MTGTTSTIVECSVDEVGHYFAHLQAQGYNVVKCEAIIANGVRIFAVRRDAGEGCVQVTRGPVKGNLRTHPPEPVTT